MMALAKSAESAKVVVAVGGGSRLEATAATTVAGGGGDVAGEASRQLRGGAVNEIKG